MPQDATAAEPQAATAFSMPRALGFLAILCLVTVLGYVHRFMITVFVDPVSGELGLNDVKIGMLQGLTFSASPSPRPASRSATRLTASAGSA
ncbi:MAG TPA: hypothetical protein VKS60_04395 [Stellaceae bacterium]|nr:hypothetical protein [Stellaceae bacterium]